MRELTELWGEIKSDQELELLTARSISAAIRKKSGTAVNKLKRMVRLKLVGCMATIVLLVVGIVLLPRIEIRILLFSMLSCYLVASVLLAQELQFLDKQIPMDQNLLGGLKTFHLRITKVMRYEEILSLLLYPITALTGFMVGMYLINPETSWLQEMDDWLKLLIPLIVLVPAAYWINRKWNDYSYGSHLKHLVENISELEKEN